MFCFNNTWQCRHDGNPSKRQPRPRTKDNHRAKVTRHQPPGAEALLRFSPPAPAKTTPSDEHLLVVGVATLHTRGREGGGTSGRKQNTSRFRRLPEEREPGGGRRAGKGARGGQ